MNWLQIDGNYITIKQNGDIIYSPTLLVPENIVANGDIIPNSNQEKCRGMIRSSRFFENGTIEFDFIVGDSKAVITLALGDLMFGTNSTYSKVLFSIREVKNGIVSTLSGTGEKYTLISGKKYNFKIVISGSTVIFYIDGVIVGTTEYIVTNSQLQFTLISEKDITIHNIVVTSRRSKVFVVMQFTDEYNELYSDVIKPVCESFGYDVIRADDFYHSNLILNDIIGSIKESSVIIADITPDNPNVFYEVGYAHALNKPTILLSDKKRVKLPFDVSGFRTLFYDNSIGGKSKVEEKLKKHLEHLNK